MAEPVPSTLPMLAAGLTATSDNAHDGPIKRRNNSRRFPPAQGSTEVSEQSRGSNRPYRGRRNDRPRQNRSSEGNPHQNQHNGPGPVGDVPRNNLNDSQRNQRTSPDNQAPVSGARTRNESQRRGSGRGFRGNRGFPQAPREPALNSDPTTTHNDGQTSQNKQHYRIRGSRNWPRIPRESAELRNDRNDAQAARDDAKVPRQLTNDSQPGSSAREPRVFNANRGRPYRYSTGRGRNRGFGDRRGEPLNAKEAPQDTPQVEQTRVDQTVIGEQGVVESAPAVGGVVQTELPEKQFSPEELAQLRVREIQQFKTRFPKSVPQDEDSYSFTFSPTDPDWVFDVRSIQLKVHFPAEYPSVPLSIVVVNTDDVLPPLLVEDVDNAIVGWIKFFHKPGQLSFRPFLRWIDRNLQEIFVESLRKIKKLQERSSVVLVDQENLNPCDVESSPENESVSESLNLDAQPVTSWPMKALPKKQKRLEELDDLFDDAVRPKPEVQKVPSHGPLGTNQLSKIFNNYDPHTPPRRGIEVKFRHVDFSESVSFVVCDRLLVSVQCKKCKKIADFQLLPGRRSVSHCAKCQTKLEACFGPSILLQFNPLLGYLELKECTIRDVALSRCHFYADCLNCTKLSPLQNVHLGQRGSSHCQNCNVKMTFVMDSFKYMDLCAIEANIKASNLKKANKDSAIQAGKPLPSNGACKHYKKSFRWFRFPCCGKAYPCDTCHDTAEDHEAEFASRMICGFCAKEQPFSNDKPCSQCSNLITGRRTAHWEGGKGCRNQLKMDTNDTRKFAGMNKTVSRKSTAKSK